MNNYVILCDSSCDLTADLRERFGIDDYLPGVLEFPDGHTEYSSLEWDKMSPVEFYTSMTKKSMYKTAIRSLADQKDFFEKYLSKGYDVLNVSLSSALSGTYGSCCIAAKELQEKYPDRKIICVDSQRYSGALALLLSKLGKMKKAGKSIDEVAQWAEDNKRRIHQMGTVDDLFFLRRMGRVSNVAAVMGSLVSIKPMADFDASGMNKIIGKAKGYKKFYEATIEYMKKTIENPEEQTIFISYSNRKPQAMQLKELIENEFHPKEIIMTTVCKACGASIGPGMATVFYMGPVASDDLSVEAKMLEEILNK